jgi:hypothetical protein
MMGGQTDIERGYASAWAVGRLDKIRREFIWMRNERKVVFIC